jgi:hypothetical protein
MENKEKSFVKEEFDRIKILKRRDLENLQEEFLKQTNANNLSVKLNKSEKNKNTAENNSKNILVEKKLGRKKEKDIIKLELDINTGVGEIEKIQKETIFVKAFNDIKENIINKPISKVTGLPETFKIEDYTKYNNTNNKTTNNERKNYIDIISNEKIEDKEYSEIHNQNIKAIKEMSKDDLIKYNQVLKTSIPAKLLEKMKTGYFQKTLRQAKIKPDEDDLAKESVQDQDEKQAEEIQIAKKDVKLVKGFNYNGELKDIEEVDIKDYSKVSFEELELANKYFSTKELSNLLSSSSDNHITIGLKVIKNIFSKQEKDKQAYIDEFMNNKLHVICLGLLEHKNINIHTVAFEITKIYFENVYHNDYREFKYNLFYFNNFPIVKKDYNDLIGLYINNNIQNLKLLFKRIFSALQSSTTLIDIYLKTFFYMLFISNELMNLFINSDLQKAFNDFINSDIKNISTAKFIIKIIQLICSFDLSQLNNYLPVINKYRKIFDNQVKTNKFFFLYSLKFQDFKQHDIKIINKPIDIVLITRLINNRTINDFISSEFITFELFDNHSKGDEQVLLRLSKVLRLRGKIFKYMNSLSEDFIILTADEIDKINKEIIRSFGTFKSLVKKDLDLCTNIYFDFCTQILNTIKLINKYPKSVKYVKAFPENEITSALFDILNTQEINELIFSDNNSDYPTFRKENFVKLILSLMKANKNNNKYQKVFSNLFYNLPSVIGNYGEYYFQKYLKYLNIFIFNKIQTVKEISEFIKISEFSSDDLNIDLNIYLSSNEDVRRSTLFKNIIDLDESPMGILYNDEANKSKYFPFKKNFILQMVHSDKLQPNLKLNYFSLLIILLFNSVDRFNDLNLFEILLRAIVNYKDLILNNKAENICNFYIEKLLLSNVIDNKLSVTLKKNKDNDLILDLFYTKFENCLDDNELDYYYKLLFLMLIIQHSNPRAIEYDNTSLSAVIYSNFTKLGQPLESVGFITPENSDKVISFIINRLDLKFSELYEIMILNYLRFKDSESFESKNSVFFRLIEILLAFFGIDKSTDYRDVQKIIFNKLK